MKTSKALQQQNSVVPKYVEPPFNYTGSKYKYLDTLLRHFDYSKSNFVDVFAGGGSVYSNVVQKYDSVHVNDNLPHLLGVHSALLYDYENFVRSVQNLVPRRDEPLCYALLRSDYNRSPNPQRLYALLLSCNNNALRFNKRGEFNQTFGKRSYNPSTERKLKAWFSAVAPHRDKLSYTTLHFVDVLHTYSEQYVAKSNFYLDPPYLGTGAGYNNRWSATDEQQLLRFCETVNSCGGSFQLSGVLNSSLPHAAVYVLSKKYNTVHVPTNYSKAYKLKNKTPHEEVLVSNK